MKETNVFARRLRLVLFAFALSLGTAALAGPRAGLLVAIGLGFGLTLEGLRFGFAGPWRRLLTERDASGVIAHFLSIGLAALAAFPLLALAAPELAPAHAPIGLAMILGAFVFGATMQIVAGCGSGVLVNAGSGNAQALVAFPAFALGAFAGTLHLDWWLGLGSLPVLSLQGLFGTVGGLGVTLAGLGLLALLSALLVEKGRRLPGPRLLVAAVLIALFATLNLVVAGQPWGVVYGLGLWGAKLADALGVDLSISAFWSTPAHAERLHQSVLTDVTSLTNLGLIAGAFVAMRWRKTPDPPSAPLALPGWLAVILAGFVMGYAARLAFGCNVGAFFSGIATGSLHGWVWFAAALLGSALGVKLRPLLVIPASGQKVTA